MQNKQWTFFAFNNDLNSAWIFQNKGYNTDMINTRRSTYLHRFT